MAELRGGAALVAACMGCLCLTAAAQTPRLTTLRLPNVAWSLAGARQKDFTALPGLARLRCLDFWTNLMEDEGAKNLVMQCVGCDADIEHQAAALGSLKMRKLVDRERSHQEPPLPSPV